MKVVEGTKIAEEILNECKSRIVLTGIHPKLVIIMVGHNASSLTYIEKKRQAGEKVGVEVLINKLETATEDQIIDLIQKYNNDTTINGIIVQLPLAGSLDEVKICSTVNPLKDVDGLNPLNLGNLWLNPNPALIPATAKAIEYTLQYISGKEGMNYEDFISGKNILIINRSSIIGKPLAALMSIRNATVIVAHSKTKNVDGLIKLADIVVSGTGKENFISIQEFKPGSILIDVGFTKTDKRIYGDVNKKLKHQNISWLTPVPGGIGPIGVACLIENVVNASLL